MSLSFNTLKQQLASCKTTEDKIAVLMQLSNPFTGNNINEVEKYAKLAVEETLLHKDTVNYEQAYFNYCHALMYNGKYQLSKEHLELEIKRIDAKANFNYSFRLQIVLLNVLFAHFDIQEAYIQTKKILKMAPENEVSKRIGVLFSLSGNVYNKLGRYENAFMFHEKAVKIFRNISDAQALAAEYSLIANVYYTIKDFNKSEEYYLKTYNISKANNLTRNVIIALQNLCSLYFEMDNEDKIKQTLQEQSVILKENKSELLQARFEYLNAQMLNKQRKFSESSEILLKTESVYKERNAGYQLIDLYKLNTNNLIELKRYQEAKVAAINGKKFAKKLGFFNQYSHFIKIEACIFKELKQYKKANRLLEKYINYNEKLKEKERKNEIAKMRAQYEIAEKEFETERFKNDAMQFQLRSLRAQLNPHFIFNLVSSVHSGLDEQSIEKSKMLLVRFARLMRFCLEFTEQDYVDLYEEIQFLDDYLFLQQFRNNFAFNYSIETEDNVDIDFLKVPSMLIQPLIENAIVHGIKNVDNGEIKVYFKEEKDYLLIEIEDNGIGRESAERLKRNNFFNNMHESKSTKINLQRLNLLNQTNTNAVNLKYIDLFDQNENPRGTRVQLKICK